MNERTLQDDPQERACCDEDLFKNAIESDFSIDPEVVVQEINDTVATLLSNDVEGTVEKNEKSFSESVNTSYINMDKAFLKYLKSFNANVKKQETLKLELKKKFFKWIMLFMAMVIAFPYVMVFVFRSKITDVTVITLSITSLAEILSAIIVLPKIIAKYLFNKKEDDNKIKIISDMQAYNKEKRYLTNNGSEL